MHDPVVEEIRRLVGRATRYGIYGSKATRRGLSLPSVHSEFRLALESLEQIVQDLSSVDVSRLVNVLHAARVDDLALDHLATFKLRMTLLLGLGQARYLPPEDRRLALARTYRLSTRPGEVDPGPYRNRASDVFRAERDSLIDQIAIHIASTLTRPEEVFVGRLPQTASQEHSYRILELDNQYVIPATPARRRVVMRRRRIEALQDGVREFRQQYTSTSHWDVTPVPRLIGVGHLTVERMRRHAENDLVGFRYDLVIRFPPLHAGEARELQWLVELEQDVERVGGHGSQFVQIVPSVEIVHAKVGVTFEHPLEPGSSWSFKDVEMGDAEVEEVATVKRVVDGHLSDEWDRPRLGRASGLRWVW